MVQKEKHEQGLRIFLSYTKADRTHANKLKGLLLQYSNLHIFTHEMLSAGGDWKTKLRDELSKCDIFVVLLTPNSANSAWVLKEIGAAWGIDKPIIPIVTHPEVLNKIPLTLSHHMFVKIEDLEKPETINRILERYEEVTV